MKKSIRKSLPSVKTTTITVVVSLTLGVIIAGGLHPKALLGLAFAVVFLMMVTFRNYDPDSFEAWNNPEAYSYRTERDKLLQSLKGLTEAVEADSNIVPPDAVAFRAAEAREVLEEVSGRYKIRAR
ncbi:MAG TPA: hypothetical protein VK963_02720 [Candidatus Saccharimonadales bacterium]|nr:hypothetical protein [Candidatus Saccharimonadales bacterium]